MTTKKCNTCNEIKNLTEFGINRKKDSVNFHAGSINRYKGDCKKCLANKQRAWRQQHPDYWKKVNNKIHIGKITKYPKEDRYLLSAIRTRLHAAKQNSTRGKHCKYDLVVDDLYALWKQQKGMCALSGLPLLLEKGTPWTLSIDKIDPNGNYTITNVQWVCTAANRAKSDLSISNLLKLCKGITETCRDYPEKEYSQVAGSAKPQEIE